MKFCFGMILSHELKGDYCRSLCLAALRVWGQTRLLFLRHLAPHHARVHAVAAGDFGSTEDV